MPIFEYACETCGATLEILQRDASVRATCGEDCVAGGEERGRGALRRLLSAHAKPPSSVAAPPPSPCASRRERGSCPNA